MIKKYRAHCDSGGVFWGVRDIEGNLVYAADMTELQARMVAMFHANDWCDEFEQILLILEAAGIDFEKLGQGMV